MNSFFTYTRNVVLLFVSFVIYASAFFLLGGVAFDKSPAADLSPKMSKGLNLLQQHPIPHPVLSPAEVVSIQLAALQSNDAKNEGIVVTFNYASPDSKTWTGPLHRFVDMVKAPVYRPLFNYKGYILDELIVDNEKAWQYVVVLDKKNQAALYLFTLKRQGNEPFLDCWMTESIEKVEVERTSYYL